MGGLVVLLVVLVVSHGVALTETIVMKGKGK